MKLVIGYAGCASTLVPASGYPVTLLEVTYWDVPLEGAEELRFETKEALDEFTGRMDKAHRAPWRLTYK